MTLALDIRRLRAVLAIAETGSFTAAAERLNVAQPALSTQIRDLEQSLGAPLFLRHARGVEPTEAGSILIDHARRILAHVRTAEDDVRRRNLTPTGQVRLGLPFSVAVMVVQPLFERLHRSHPGIAVRLEESFSGTMSERLADHRLDLAVLVGDPAHGRVAARTIMRERMYLILPARWSGATAAQIPLVEACRQPLILPSRSHGVRALMESHATVLGLPLNLRHEVDSAHQLIALVEAGLGATVLSTSAIRHARAAGTVRAVPIVDPVVRRRVSIAWAGDRALDGAAAAVHRMLLGIAQDLIATGVWEAEWVGDETPAADAAV